MELIEFLTARLDEDETAARESYYEGQWWLTEEEDVYRWPDDELVHSADRKADARHIARHDPARALREIEAGRAILAELDRMGTTWEAGGARIRLAHDAVLRLLAAIYSDHPDYRPEWRPTP